MTFRVCVSAALLTVSQFSHAGSDFLRISCVPETGHFSVEYKSFEGYEDQLSLSRPELKALSRAWRREGFFDPTALNYECRMQESTYRIETTNSFSRAGDVCDITLTLKWFNEVWLDRVRIGPGCGSGTNINSIEIQDGRRVSRKPQSMTLCIASASDFGKPKLCEPFQPHPTQHRLQVLNQADLDEYVDSRNAPVVSPSSENQWKRDSRSLNRFLAERSPCEFSGLNLPNDAAIHVLINGQRRELPFGIDPEESRASVGDVFVNSPNKRVALIVLTAGEPTVWNFHWTPSTDIVAVAAMGTSKVAFAGLPRNTPVFTGHLGSGTACKYFSVSPGFPERERQEVAAFTEHMYRRPADTVTHFRSQNPATVGEKVANGLYVQASDTPVDRLATAASELIGHKGLDRLEQSGAIRQASQQDIASWLRAWKAAYPHKAKRLTASNQELHGLIGLYKTFVVLKPIRFPTGLVGAEGATFIVPKGVPRPVGEQGHSVVYNVQTGSCIAKDGGAQCFPFPFE